MPKTDHNLKALEKKIRQAVSLIDELRHPEKPTAKEPVETVYADLPLLKGIPGSGRSDAERQRIRERIDKLIEEIEKVLD